jgi:hypothetical protein
MLNPLDFFQFELFFEYHFCPLETLLYLLPDGGINTIMILPQEMFYPRQAADIFGRFNCGNFTLR